MANISKGEWKVEEVSENAPKSEEINFLQNTDEYQILNEDGIECIAVMGTAWARGFAKANADIIVAAVNACQEVNPDNPMAVAESIKDMYEAVGIALWHEKHGEYESQKQGKPRYCDVLQILRQAKAKAEGRE